MEQNTGAEYSTSIYFTRKKVFEGKQYWNLFASPSCIHTPTPTHAHAHAHAYVYAHNREDFTKKLEALVKVIRPDDQDFTTIEHIRDGLSGHGGSKLDRDGIHETEWVSFFTPTTRHRTQPPPPHPHSHPRCTLESTSQAIVCSAPTTFHAIRLPIVGPLHLLGANKRKNKQTICVFWSVKTGSNIVHLGSARGVSVSRSDDCRKRHR